MTPGGARPTLVALSRRRVWVSAGVVALGLGVAIPGALGAVASASTRGAPSSVPTGGASAFVAHHEPELTDVADPANNITPAQTPQNFLLSKYCSTAGGQFDNSSTCTSATLTDINYALGQNGVAPIALPADWGSLNPGEQLLTAFNLVRASYGLPPILGLGTAQDGDANTGAANGTDPTGIPPGEALNGGTIWAGGDPNAIAATFDWVFNDGWGGAGSTNNGSCTSATDAACWGHREVVLTECQAAFPLASCQYVAGASAVTSSGRTSFAAEVYSFEGPAAPLDYTYPTSSPTQGYWLVAGDGGIFTFGAAQFYGSTGNLHLQRPVVGMTTTADRAGYWMVATDGGMFAFGDALYHGSLPGLGYQPAGSGSPKSLNAPIDAMVASPTGNGYLLVAADGGVFAFGDALFHGSCPGIGGCAGSVVAVVPDTGELGYWVVTSTGHVYAFGNAHALGQPASISARITGATASADGNGYLLVDALGDVYAYGDAHQYGAAPGGIGLGNSIEGIVPTSTGQGYWLMGSEGAVYAYGDALDHGSMAGRPLNAPIVTAAGF